MNLRNIKTEELLDEMDRRFKCEQQPKMNVILVGPPGAGKGTHGPTLSDHLCICHRATGDMLRAAVSAGSELGKKAKDIMAKGQLVPDDLVIGLIKDLWSEPECERGILLDGFPRTTAQAEALDRMFKDNGKSVDRVVEFAVDEEVLAERIVGRRIHKNSGRSYHLKFNPPKVEGKDDITGEPLIHRPDDTREALTTRLEGYRTQTTPILDFYKKQNKLKSVNATQKIDLVWNEIKDAVHSKIL